MSLLAASIYVHPATFYGFDGLSNNGIQQTAGRDTLKSGHPQLLIPNNVRDTHRDVAEAHWRGHTLIMSNADFDFSNLSVPERIQLAEDLWDSVAAQTPDLPLAQAEIEELERRLDEVERNPDACIPWDEARARIERHLRQRD